MVRGVHWALWESELEMENRMREAHWGVFPGPTPVWGREGTSTAQMKQC